MSKFRVANSANECLYLDKNEIKNSTTRRLLKRYSSRDKSHVSLRLIFISREYLYLSTCHTIYVLNFCKYINKANRIRGEKQAKFTLN